MSMWYPMRPAGNGWSWPCRTPSGLGARTAASFTGGYDLKPKPFKPELLDSDERYVRDQTTGLVWHRCLNRTLYADTDRSSVVYHSNYLRYFEFGRASLMRDAA